MVQPLLVQLRYDEDLAFRAGADIVGLVTSTATIPSSVRSGDTLLLFYEVADDAVNVTGPGGDWELVDSEATTSADGYLWWKRAESSDAGTDVSVLHDGAAGLKSAIVLGVWTGVAVDAIHAYTVEAAGASSATHVCPDVETTIDGCLIIQAVTAKSTTNESWAVDGDWVIRESVLNTGTGVADGAVADDATLVDAGTHGGATFTMSVATANATKWSIALAPAPSWHDHTGDVLVENQISITQGRSDFATQAEPAEARLQFGSWDFNPDNALSPLSGLIGRNTPLRIIAADEVTVSLDLHSHSPSANASTPDSSALNLTGDVDWRIDLSPRGGHWREAHLASKSSWPGLGRLSWLLQLEDDATITLLWSQDGATWRTATSTAAIDTSEARLALRVVQQGDNGSGGSDVSFWTAASIDGVYTQLGATVTVGGGTASWFDTTATLRLGAADLTMVPPPAMLVPQSVFNGRVHAFELRTGLGAGSLIANPDFATQEEGATEFIDGAGLAWTVDTGARICAEKVRFTGEVASWVPKQSQGEDPKRWVDVVAAGILRRLGQGADALRTAPHRFAIAEGALDFWPLDDPQGSVTAGNALGGQPMLPEHPTTEYFFGQNALSLWADGASSTTGGALDSDMGATVRGSLSGGSWAGDVLYRATEPSDWGDMEGPMSLRVDMFSWAATVEAVIEFLLVVDPQSDAILLRVFNLGAGTTLASSDTAIGTLADGQPHHIRLKVTDGSGNNVTVESFIDGVLSDAEIVNIGQANLPAVGHVELTPGTGAEPTFGARVHFGQFAVWRTPPDIGEAPADNPWLGYQGETAADRIARLATEEGIPILVYNGKVADTDVTQLSVPLGPQHADGLADLLNQAAAVDDGVLSDDREVPGGLFYRTGQSRYNQPAVLTLDYEAGQVAPPLDPVVDDQATANDVTRTHADGGVGEAHVVDETGPLGVDTIGRTTTSDGVNTIPAPYELERQARWQLHLGTTEATRYPQLTVDLDRAPELVAQVDGLDLADRVDLTSLPLELSPEDMTLQVAGWTETIGTHRRKIILNCVPEEPYHIVDPDAGLHNRVGFSSLWRRSGTITDVQTGISLRNEEGPDISFESDFDIVIGGERMTVTAIGAWGGTYPARSATFTVVRGANGVQKPHPNNVRATLFDRGYIGL